MPRARRACRPRAGWESSSGIDWEHRALVELQVQLASGEQRVIEVHLP